MQHFHIAIALIWNDGRVLISKRRDDADHLPGLWEFPGGKCGEGEAPEECAVREVREETGLEINVTATRAPMTFDYPERIVTLHPFDCEVVGDTRAQALQSAEVRWALPDELHIEDFPAANMGLIEELKRG
ncbi:MAG TPA: (deoxy)nucleoside triphosphate pyrophosphohydrolase [Abditibacteriaceae bacterium]|jgi:mutator protein MutT